MKMYKYRYCPSCGKFLNSVREGFYECPECKFKLYINVAASAVALIFNQQDQLLMVRRAYDPGKGMWSIPGGFMEKHESAEEGLKREIWEETKLKINKFEYFASIADTYRFQGLDYPTLMLTFKAELPKGGKIKLSDEATEWKWTNVQDIDLDEVGNDDVREVVRRWKRLIA